MFVLHKRKCVLWMKAFCTRRWSSVTNEYSSSRAGCRDYSAYLGVSAALKWWREVGPNNVRAYMNGLLESAVRHLIAVWKSDALAPLPLLACMACVRLPEAMQSTSRTNPSTSVEAKALQVCLKHPPVMWLVQPFV